MEYNAMLTVSSVCTNVEGLKYITTRCGQYTWQPSKFIYRYVNICIAMYAYTCINFIRKIPKKLAKIYNPSY